MKRLIACTLILAPLSLAAQPVVPADTWADRQLADPVAEARATDLMEKLRCLVCQGQSIADSDAPIAADMRALVRRRIAAGESPDAVRAWLIARYGAYVSYDPPLDTGTLLLWAAPVGLLALGAWLAARKFHRRSRP